jgi:hypothetical protein
MTAMNHAPPPRRRARVRAFAPLLAALALAPGCVEHVSRNAAKGVLDATKEHESKPDANDAAKRLVADVVADPAVRRATRELAAAGVHGVADGVREELAGVDADLLTDDAARAMRERLGAEMGAAFDAATPHLRTAVRAAAAEAVLGMSAAMRESARRDAPVIAQAAVAAVMQAMGAPPADAAALGPASGGDGPAAAAAVTAETPTGYLVRTAARAAVLGLNEGAREAGLGVDGPPVSG